MAVGVVNSISCTAYIYLPFQRGTYGSIFTNDVTCFHRYTLHPAPTFMHACHDDADPQASASGGCSNNESVVPARLGFFVGNGQTGCRVLGADAQRGNGKDNVFESSYSRT